jgi:hypothetical protein
MSLKPPMNEPFGSVQNAVTTPKKVDHYAQVAGTVTTTKPTGNPCPANSGAGTHVSGPVPGAHGPAGGR